MKQRLLFALLVAALLVLAAGGWTVQGLRWAASGGRLRGVPQPA
jgi:outer membrane lipopolysaccharide assembly protein LptE/RlpB